MMAVVRSALVIPVERNLALALRDKDRIRRGPRLAEAVVRWLESLEPPLVERAVAHERLPIRTLLAEAAAAIHDPTRRAPRHRFVHDVEAGRALESLARVLRVVARRLGAPRLAAAAAILELGTGALGAREVAFPEAG